MSPEDIVVMGQIGAPFGVKGWVKIFADTEHPDSLFDYPVWYIETPKGWQAFEIENAELHTKNLVAKLAGIDDHNLAETFRNRKLGVPRSAMPEPEEGEYYWSDLVGMEVVNCQGVVLGRIEDLISTGAHEVLCVRAESESGQGGSSGRERLLPFIASVVKTVDMQARSVCVDWQADW